jgi:hypothetical protein
VDKLQCRKNDIKMIKGRFLVEETTLVDCDEMKEHVKQIKVKSVEDENTSPLFR